jgi:tetratricopeptide (TPR) repeat protein
MRRVFDRPFSIAFRGIDLMAYYMRIGDTAQGLQAWQANKPMFGGIFADGEGFFRAVYGVAIENPDTIGLGIEQVQRFSDAFGADPRFLVQMRAEKLKFEGKAAEAAAHYGDFINSRRGQIYRGRVDLAEYQRLAGDLDAAQETIDEVLELLPRYSDGLLEAAEIARARGRSEAARQYLDELLSVWGKADPDFQPMLRAQRMRAALDEAG